MLSKTTGSTDNLELLNELMLATRGYHIIREFFKSHITAELYRHSLGGLVMLAEFLMFSLKFSILNVV